jgi:hypothetical protein
MSPDRTHHLLVHVTLALAGVCLTLAEVTYLPEITLVLPFYVGFVGLSWWQGQRKALAAWLANVLALILTGGAILWMAVRSGSIEESWSRDVPIAVLLIPYLGAVLMALSILRLFRPPTPVDFWMLQGLGVLQVALGCVLASGLLFDISLIAYLIVAGCAVACHERHVQTRHGPGEVITDAHGQSNGSSSTLLRHPNAPQSSSWLVFSLRWTPAVALLVGILFLITPRLEGPDWDPLARFGVQPPKIRLHVGFNDEIDLTRVGRMECDTTPAFTVQVQDRAGRLVRGIAETQRFRGLVLDQYNDRRWRRNHDLTGHRGPPPAPPKPLVIERTDVLVLKFHVPREAGGLFLAEPVLQGPEPRMLPIALEDSTAAPRLPLFFEAAGSGTIVSPPLLFTEPEFRYMQTFLGGASRERYPAIRVTDNYLKKLIDTRRLDRDIIPWSIDLVRRMDRLQFPEAEFLRPQLERMREPGGWVPRRHWEPIARLFTNYLSSSGDFTWSAEVRRQDRLIDPVLDFLFNVKQGPCDRFASALTMLLRAQHIPARIVVGFRGAEYKGEGTYVVYNHFAHAWVEVLVPAQTGPGNEWLLLDPSPPEAVPSTTALVRFQRSSQALWRDLMLGYGSGEEMDFWDNLISGRLLNSLAPLLGLPLLLGALLWAVKRRRRHGARLSKSGSLYDRMLGLLARRMALVPEPGETPIELAERAAAALSHRPATAALADVPLQVVGVHYSMRFGGRSPVEASLREAAGRLEELSHALGGGSRS